MSHLLTKVDEPDALAPVDRAPPVERRAPAERREPPLTGTTYHEHVRAIIEQKCLGCHIKGGIGPFTLSSYKEAKAVSVAIKTAVLSKRMPPWLADNSCGEYKHSLALSATQQKQIIDWIDNGTPEGDPAKYVPPKDDGNIGIPRVDVSLKLPVPYLPAPQGKGSTDDYRCFVIDWPKTEKSFVTGFRVKAGNKAIVHHVIAYLGKANTKAHLAACLDSNREKARNMGRLCLKDIRNYMTPPPAPTPPPPPIQPPPPAAPTPTPPQVPIQPPQPPAVSPPPVPPIPPAPTPPPAVPPTVVITKQEEPSQVCPIPRSSLEGLGYLQSYKEGRLGPFGNAPYIHVVPTQPSPAPAPAPSPQQEMPQRPQQDMQEHPLPPQAQAQSVEEEEEEEDGNAWLVDGVLGAVGKIASGEGISGAAQEVRKSKNQADFRKEHRRREKEYQRSYATNAPQFPGSPQFQDNRSNFGSYGDQRSYATNAPQFPGSPQFQDNRSNFGSYGDQRSYNNAQNYRPFSQERRPYFGSGSGTPYGSAQAYTPPQPYTSFPQQRIPYMGHRQRAPYGSMNPYRIHNHRTGVYPSPSYANYGRISPYRSLPSYNSYGNYGLFSQVRSPLPNRNYR